MRTTHVSPVHASTFDWVAILPALIGFAGLLLVWALTRRWERAKERRERSVESVAAVVSSVSGFMEKWDTTDEVVERTWKAHTEFVHALSVFGAREIHDNPTAARWAIAQSKEFSNLTATELAAVDPDDETAHLTFTCVTRAGQIAGTLLRWMSRGGRDKAFDPTLAANIADL